MAPASSVRPTLHPAPCPPEAFPSHSQAEVTITLVRAGDGENYPRRSQSVAIHYDAFLANGAEWDSSRRRGKPLRFRVSSGQVIPGLDHGVMQMSVGELVRLRVPAELASAGGHHDWSR